VLNVTRGLITDTDRPDASVPVQRVCELCAARFELHQRD
jgi:hypothetical protein